MAAQQTMEDWDRQEAEESFVRARFVIDGVGYWDDFETWEQEVGTWDELKERALLLDARWVERPEQVDLVEFIRRSTAGTVRFCRGFG